MSRSTALKPIFMGLGVLAVAVAILISVVALADSGDVEVRLGDDRFNAGEAESLAEEIDENGPLLFPDLLVGGRRYIFLNHIGDDVDSGWVAFSAYRDETNVECPLEWLPDEARFRDRCTDDRVPADGEGLTQYPVEVDEDGDVIVDLTPEGEPGRGPTTTVTPGTEPESTLLVTGSRP